MTTSPEEPIAIADFRTGSELIGCVPLVNSPEAAHELEKILDSLLAAPPGHQTFFQLLEQASLPLAFVAEELAKRYINKPVPLDDVEDSIFQSVMRLLLKMSKAYTHCAEASTAASKAPKDEYLATLLHRCIYFTGLTIFEYQRVRREVPWGLWLSLHSHYGTAEERGLESLPVPNVNDETAEKKQCAAAYLSFVLYDMAGSYSLSLRDQRLVRRWVSLWSSLVQLRPAAMGETLPPFVIDLVHDAALRPSSECLHTDQIRCLDTSRLADHITHIRQALKQRVSPSTIALGEDCTRQQCARLLGILSRQWSQVRAARKFRRRATSGVVHVCMGFEEMYYFIAGKEFRQPENVSIYAQYAQQENDFDDVFSLRFQGKAAQARQETPATPYIQDTWEMVDQSANGFRLIRNSVGRKIVHGQLLALRPHDNDRFFLAQVTWLMQENNGDGLIAGLQVLPGLPQAVCVRQSALGPEGKSPYQRAFLMPALTTASAGQSLIVPAGWFRPNLPIEIFINSAQRASLKKVLDSGPDFERITFKVG